MKKFIKSQPNITDLQKVETSLKNIKDKIADINGISHFIELDDGSVAFAGTTEKPELLLEMGIDNNSDLYASIDDEVSWQEWDFKTQEEFENDIVKYVSERINRTIKIVKEHKKHKYIRTTEYYLDKETNEWVLFAEINLKWLILRPFITKDSYSEQIKTFVCKK